MLELLLQDTDSNRRFEVEVQLGDVDESHIIRTIEYWDIEKINRINRVQTTFFAGDEGVITAELSLPQPLVGIT